MGLVAVVVVILLFVACYYYLKQEDSSSCNGEDNATIIDETISILEIVGKFGSSAATDQCGLVMIIPVDSSENMYSAKSDKLRISLLLYTDDRYLVSIYEAGCPEIKSRFELISETDGTLSYVGYTYSHFSGSYKSFMPHCFEEIRRAFPNTEFKFDGSRVMTDKFIG